MNAIDRIFNESFPPARERRKAARKGARLEGKFFTEDEDTVDGVQWRLSVDGAMVGFFFGTRRDAEREARDVASEIGALEVEVSIAV